MFNPGYWTGVGYSIQLLGRWLFIKTATIDTREDISDLSQREIEAKVAAAIP